MGHHSKRNKNTPNPPPIPYPNPLGQFFNGLDINTMSNILSNIDLKQISSLLTNATQGRTNTSTTVESAETPPQEGAPPKLNITDLFKEFQRDGLPKEGNYNPELPPDDPAVIVLNGLKPLLPPEKCEIVDSFIKLLGIKKVIDSIFPPQSTNPTTVTKDTPLEDIPINPS